MKAMGSLIVVCMSAALLASYIILYVVCHGWPGSVSESYYHIEHKWMFSAVVAVSGALILVPWLNLGGPVQCCAFISVAAIMFIAASPAFKDGLTRSVHIGASVVMFVSAIAWEAVCGGVWLPLAVGIIFAIARRREAVFWLEIGLFAEVYLSLILKLL